MFWIGLLRGVGLTVETTFLFINEVLVEVPGSTFIKSTTISQLNSKIISFYFPVLVNWHFDYRHNYVFFLFFFWSISL